MNSFRLSLFLFLVSTGLATAASPRTDADWQWSVAVGAGRAFLWIPPECAAVRAVMVGQHNMIEEAIFEDPLMRTALARLGIAEVWIAPVLDQKFDFNQGAGERFDALMKVIAGVSGYAELASAPVIPIGHSACATYPWNFAAWSPGRTLALISVHGDAPQTNLTGYGGPNVEWGDRSIDGVPALMVMGEYEWLESRLKPALDFRAKHPHAPIALLAEPGRGHFDTSPDLIRFLARFIEKAAAARLPAETRAGQVPQLRPVRAEDGWLVERWHLDQSRTLLPARFAEYTGNKEQAFWCFDREMAEATQHYRENQIGKKPQLLGYAQDGQMVKQTATHQQVNLRYEPAADGMTFTVGTAFLSSVEGGSPNLARWTHQPVGSGLGHAATGGPIKLSVITGPVVQLDATTFRLALNRTASTVDRRSNDIWLLAEQAGDKNYKSAVQQALLKVGRNRIGAPQTIEFDPIGDRRVGDLPFKLRAHSDSGLPVQFYLREGPAVLDGSTLRVTKIPPRARFPMQVTVVAWQGGRAVPPAVQEAAMVERTFLIKPPL